MADLALIESKETAKAAQAFADYVALGPSRSLRKLVEFYNRPKSYLAQLAVWSTEYHWQERLAEMALSRAEEANGYRADTYVAITKKYHQIVVVDEPNGMPVPLKSLHAIYDRVKPEQAAAPIGVGVQVTLAFYDRTDGPS